jgi:hypothetical protein
MLKLKTEMDQEIEKASALLDAKRKFEITQAKMANKRAIENGNRPNTLN